MRRGQSEVIVHEYPATFTVERVLEDLAHALQASGLSADGGVRKTSRRRFFITLSHSLCMGINYSLPDGVRRWAECDAYIRATAAALPENSGIDIEAEFDQGAGGVAANIPTQLLKELQDWSLAQRGTLCSLRPLWSIATECPAAQSKKITELILQEPDGVFCLRQTEDLSLLTCISYPLEVAQDEENTERGSSARDCTLVLKFSPKVAASAKGVPTLWREHWSRQ